MSDSGFRFSSRVIGVGLRGLLLLVSMHGGFIFWLFLGAGCFRLQPTVFAGFGSVEPENMLGCWCRKIEWCMQVLKTFLGGFPVLVLIVYLVLNYGSSSWEVLVFVLILQLLSLVGVSVLAWWCGVVGVGLNTVWKRAFSKGWMVDTGCWDVLYRLLEF